MFDARSRYSLSGAAWSEPVVLLAAVTCRGSRWLFQVGLHPCPDVAGQMAELSSERGVGGCHQNTLKEVPTPKGKLAFPGKREMAELLLRRLCCQALAQ